MKWFLETFGHSPPADYMKFMLSNKNSTYRNVIFDFINEYGKNDTSDIHYWFVMNAEKSYLNLVYKYEQACDNEIIDNDYMPIAEDSGGNLICMLMNTAKEDFGRIYFAVHDSEEPLYCNLASSFTEFLASLRENTP